MSLSKLQIFTLTYSVQKGLLKVHVTDESKCNQFSAPWSCGY